MWPREAVVHSIRIQCVDDARKQVCSVVASKQYSDVAQQHHANHGCHGL